MRAASARAIASQRNASTEEGLERAVAWSRQWSAEFPFCLANHLPMVLVALHRMGASDERLEAYCRCLSSAERARSRPRTDRRDHGPQLARIFGRTRARSRLSRVFRRRGCAAWRDAGRNSLSPAAHARRRGERHPRAHAHGLCDADRQRRGDQRRARLLGGDLSPAQAFARAQALDRRSGRGSRLHVWAGGVPACRARARSSVALHARGRRETGICARRRHAGDRPGDA